MHPPYPGLAFPITVHCQHQFPITGHMLLGNLRLIVDNGLFLLTQADGMLNAGDIMTRLGSLLQNPGWVHNITL